MALKNQPFVRDATLVESEIHLLVTEEASEVEIDAALGKAGLKSTGIRPIEPSLEDVFVTLTRKLAKE
jgi:hypothetical protein